MCPSLSLSGYAAVADSQAALRRRKLSQAVANRLIGWRSEQTQQLVVEQAKSLCGKYLRAKLRSCALLHKKLGLQRLKSVSHLSSSTPWSSAEVALELRELGLEMERAHPELFQSVMENVGLYSLPSEGGVQNLLAALAAELFREGHVTWGRVVALYAVAGALAVDCVKMGHPEFVLGLVQVVGNSVERDLGSWIIQQGGWDMCYLFLTSLQLESPLSNDGCCCRTLDEPSGSSGTRQACLLSQVIPNGGPLHPCGKETSFYCRISDPRCIGPWEGLPEGNQSATTRFQ